MCTPHLWNKSCYLVNYLQIHLNMLTYENEWLFIKTESKIFWAKIYKEKISLNFNKWDLEDELCCYVLSCIYKLIGLWIFFCSTGSSSIWISFPLYFNYLDTVIGLHLNCPGCSDGVISHAWWKHENHNALNNSIPEFIPNESSRYSPVGDLNIL